MKEALFLILGIGLGALLWHLTRQLVFKNKMEEANKALNDAKSEAEKVIKQAEIRAQEEILEGKKVAENSKLDVLKEFKERERRLNKREEQINQRDEINIAREREFKTIEKRQKDTEAALAEQQTKLTESLANVEKELERISGMTQDEAKEELIQKLEEEAKHDAAKKIKIGRASCRERVWTAV